jgi:hypothetical protein
MKTRLETIRVQTRIKGIGRKLYYTEVQRGDMLTELRNTFIGHDFHWLEQAIRILDEKEYEMVKKRQIKKFTKLIKEKENIENKRKQKSEEQDKLRKEKIRKEVVDRTKDGIDDDFKISLIIHEENTKKNHNRVVSLYVIKISLDLHKL